MLILFALLGFSLTLFEDTPKYLESFSVYSETPQINYKLIKIGENDTKLDTINYKPVVNSYQGLSIATKYFSIGGGFQVPEKKNEGLDTSTLFDLQLFDYYDRYIWEAYYQNYQGLYITEDENINSTDLPRSNTLSYGVNIRYFLNDEFRPKHSFSNFSNEKRTNWSWVLGAFVNKSILESSEGLIPAQYQNNFSQLAGLESLDTDTIGLDFGYGGLHKFEYLFISGFMSLNYSLENQRFDGIDQESRIVSATGLNLFLEFGHDASWGSVSLAVRANGLQFPVKNTRFEQTRSLVSFSFKKYF